MLGLPVPLSVCLNGIVYVWLRAAICRTHPFWMSCILKCLVLITSYHMPSINKPEARALWTESQGLEQQKCRIYSQGAPIGSYWKRRPSSFADDLSVMFFIRTSFADGFSVMPFRQKNIFPTGYLWLFIRLDIKCYKLEKVQASEIRS